MTPPTYKSIVIPAKAGIQSVAERRATSGRSNNWIPAFAEMTVGLDHPSD
jgi:hypothetical protein